MNSHGLRDGRNDRITRRCYELVKQYDEFGYLAPEAFHIVFDSKQNLGSNFNGSMYNYFR